MTKEKPRFGWGICTHATPYLPYSTYRNLAPYLLHEPSLHFTALYAVHPISEWCSSRSLQSRNQLLDIGPLLISSAFLAA
jgi:hypothetical protein